MAKYKIIGLPKQTEEYFELDLTPEEIEEYARGGFIVEDISVPSLSHAQEGGEPKRKKHRFIKDTEEAKQFPADEWGQYIQEEPEVVVRPLTPEQQQARNMEWARMEMARRNPHLYLPDGTLRPQAAQSADWVWQLGAMGPAGLEGLGALAAKQIPRTGLTVGTLANTAAGIHGATQVPQRIQDWQDVAEGKKDWREATAESLMTGLELYGGYDAARTLLPQAYKINPWAFKADPEAYYHRSPNLENIINKETGMLQGFGQSEAGKLFSETAGPGLGKGINLKKAANNKLYFSKGVPLDYGRYNPETFNSAGKRIMSGQGYPGPYIAEVKGVPMGSSTKGRLPGLEPTRLESYAVSKRPISLDEVKFYKEHWLKGYKEVPRELPGSPNSFSIFPRKPIPLSDRSLEFGKASKTIGGDQIPEHQWFNKKNKELYEKLQQELSQQKAASEELSGFGAKEALDKINKSKVSNETFKKLIMGDDLKFKMDDYPNTPRIPFTTKDLKKEGVNLYPKAEYQLMDDATREEINVLNNIERGTDRIPEANQALDDIKGLANEMAPTDFVKQFRMEIRDPKTGKPYTLAQVKKASPQQIGMWRKQIIQSLLKPTLGEIEIQNLSPKIEPGFSGFNFNKEGGSIQSSKRAKLNKFIS